MTTQRFKRKLTAILFADVEGYSRLMGENEVATVRTLSAYRKVMISLIQKDYGRLVDSPGDNLLAEFASVLNAVECAITIQQELESRNAALPENRKMKFRIGINLGDVIIEGERIYGDGVNIAARIEALAEAGNICLSRSVHDQVKKKLPIYYQYLGAHAVKNISEPIEVYRIQLRPEKSEGWVKKIKRAMGQQSRNLLFDWTVLLIGVLSVFAVHHFRHEPQIHLHIATNQNPPLQLSIKPAIAVMPFQNINHNPEQEHFIDGMTDDLITDLSKIPDLKVISRNSVFKYKNKPADIRQLAKELGVRYVLEGSVRMAGEQVRINVQLTDATTGKHLWAERYDEHLHDVFALQDKIVQKIVGTLKVKLTASEHEETIFEAKRAIALDNNDPGSHWEMASSLIMTKNSPRETPTVF